MSIMGLVICSMGLIKSPLSSTPENVMDIRIQMYGMLLYLCFVTALIHGHLHR